MINKISERSINNNIDYLGIFIKMSDCSQITNDLKAFLESKGHTCAKIVGPPYSLEYCSQDICSNVSNVPKKCSYCSMILAEQLKLLLNIRRAAT